MFVALAIAAMSCTEKPSQPRPKGYFRIDLPEKQYTKLDTMRYYGFEYPIYGTVTPDFYSRNEKDWINVEFPKYKGTLHLSYKQVNGNLSDYIEDTYSMVTKHITKAMGIRDSLMVNHERKVYGLAYFLDGVDVASPMQFFVTDSTRHFMRGSLYFNLKPNNDSLQPVIKYITDDILHIINTLEWKN